MCGAWSEGGGWSATSADNVALRWRAAAREASFRASARGVAHGWWLHVQHVEAGRAGGSGQRGLQLGGGRSRLMLCPNTHRAPSV
jgi:hypothetical protein